MNNIATTTILIKEKKTKEKETKENNGEWYSTKQ